MSLKIYNTLTSKKETFIPIQKNTVRMYVCGPTVYDTSHIGHARSVVVFDMISRWLTRIGYGVTYVRNFTDVDDKIIKKSNETDEACSTITEKYIAEFHNEMDALNVLRPTMEPKATEHIQHIIRFVQKLVEKGKAYAVDDGNVYFSIDTFEGYGKLSGRNPEDMRAGARVAVEEKKKNPLDFTLWKPAKPGEPYWGSPWGNGRPGWHIECSAMSHEYLGKGFDIHGGGKDLIFPHHENEIAQSEALFGTQFVRYWIHNGFVDINNEKMSKSLGNFTMIKDMLARYSPEVIRMFLLSKHYRSPIDFSEQSMREVEMGLDRIYGFLERMEDLGIQPAGTDAEGPLWQAFANAMNDDFNSAWALAAVFETVKKGNKTLDRIQDQPDDPTRTELAQIRTDMAAIAGILGIFQETPSAWFDAKRDKGMADMAVNPETVETLLAERAQAREDKNFARADKIRDQLQEMNIILKDGPGGTVWRFS